VVVTVPLYRTQGCYSNEFLLHGLRGNSSVATGDTDATGTVFRV